MSLEIKIVEGDSKWDQFVFDHPGGSIYHHSTWRQVLLSSFHYQPRYLALLDTITGAYHGVYPFMLVQSRLTGDRLVALPFSAYCAPLMPPEAVAEVLDYVLKLHPGMQYLELKFAESPSYLPDHFHCSSDFITHSLDLSIGEAALWKSFHPTSIRQRITKAEKQKFKLCFAQSEEDLKRFYRLHTIVRQRHGLPPHPYRFFANIWKILGAKDLAFIPFIEHEGKMVAGAITMKYKGTYSYEYSAADEEYRSVSPNQLLAWEVIKMGCREGATCFDFGRSSVMNTTLIEYKDRWGAKRLNLAYYYYPKAQKTGVDGSVGRRLLSQANRFLPRPLLQLEGELLYPHLG